MDAGLDFIKIFKDYLTQPVPLGVFLLLMILEAGLFVMMFREVRKNHRSAFDSLERVNNNLITSMENKDTRISELEGSLHAASYFKNAKKEVGGGDLNGDN